MMRAGKKFGEKKEKKTNAENEVSGLGILSCRQRPFPPAGTAGKFSRDFASEGSHVPTCNLSFSGKAMGPATCLIFAHCQVHLSADVASLVSGLELQHEVVLDLEVL